MCNSVLFEEAGVLVLSWPVNILLARLQKRRNSDWLRNEQEIIRWGGSMLACCIFLYMKGPGLNERYIRVTTFVSELSQLYCPHPLCTNPCHSLSNNSCKPLTLLAWKGIEVSLWCSYGNWRNISLFRGAASFSSSVAFCKYRLNVIFKSSRTDRQLYC